MALGGEDNFTGKLRLPLPETFSGNPADWEEWSWNFKAYISMFEVGAVTLMEQAEVRTAAQGDFTDVDLNVIWTPVIPIWKQPLTEYFSPGSYIT